MAEAGQAPATGATRLNININAQYDSNVSQGSVDNGGQVYFNCAPPLGARVYTSPAASFNGETNGYLSLSNGNNGPFTPSGDDFIITYCCCATVGTPCSPISPKAGGGYTIQVGDPPEPGDEKE